MDYSVEFTNTFIGLQQVFLYAIDAYEVHGFTSCLKNDAIDACEDLAGAFQAGGEL